VVRFFIVRSHYRSELHYSDAHLADAKAALTRLYTALKDFSLEDVQPDWSEPRAIRFKAAMDDDFNTAEAVAELQLLAHEAFGGDAKAAAQLKALGAILGILQRDPQDFLQAGRDGPSESEIQEKIAERLAARKAKNYAEADRIRQSLEKEGVILEDGPKGTTWRRA
jgi:cysteinyl-tRNA synthetase